jgi:hypothetical protein
MADLNAAKVRFNKFPTTRFSLLSMIDITAIKQL